jgi:hypothetical protein
MLTSLIVLSCTSFALLYPLCLWLHPGVAITQTFVRFTIGLSLALALVAAVLVVPARDTMTSALAVAWVVSLVIVLCVYWNRNRIHEPIATLPCVLGAILFVRVLQGLDQAALAPGVWIMSLIGGAIAVLVVYDTTLGHWFLETRGRVPVGHLMLGVKILWAALVVRLVWDIVHLFRITAYSYGEPVSMFRYMAGIDGFFLLVAIVMGTLLPCVLMWFVYKTLKISSTTSATGVLYSTVLCVLMGDLIYRYYMIVHGFVL